MAMELNEKTFSAEVLNEKNKIVLVDFWAPWCGPCRAQTPVLEQFAKENENVKVCKINVDDNQSVAQKYGVMSIPTLIVFSSGAPVKKAVGLQNIQGLKNLTSI